MTRFAPVVLVFGLVLGCADTNAPPPDPIELFAVVNTQANSVTIAPVDQSEAPITVQLGNPRGRPTAIAARDRFAMVTMGDIDQVAVVDLLLRTMIHRIPLPAGGRATGAIMLNDTIGYVANPLRNSVSQVNVLSRQTSEALVGVYPQGFAFARGRLFVLNGNLDTAGEPIGASWITVLNPATNQRAPGIDSIPLTGPGNAAYATVAGDGLIYLVNRGGSMPAEGRLSVVDPLERQEVASFAGLGLLPGEIASDGGARIFVSSQAEGLLEFNTDSNAVVRGEGEGVPIPTNSGVAVDSEGRVYGIEAGPCLAGQPGFAHVLDEDLVQIRLIQLGRCAGAAIVVRIGVESGGGS
jgi:DNA-binding beta-propeller fold protein YncE